MQVSLNSQKVVTVQSVLIKTPLWQIFPYPMFIINMEDNEQDLIFYQDFSHHDRDSNGAEGHLKC